MNIDQLQVNASDANETAGINIRVLYNATLTGGSFNDIDPIDSSVQLRDSITAVSGGFELFNVTIYPNKTYTFSGKDLQYIYKNIFSYGAIVGTTIGTVEKEQSLTVVATPMGATPINVAANFVGGEIA